MHSELPPRCHRGGARLLEGTLLANNAAGSATGSGAVEVWSHATLGGTVRISGAVTLDNHAVLAPSNSAGTLTLGSLNLYENSVLQFDLDIPHVIGGGINDLIVLNGSLVLDGILHVTAGPHFRDGDYTLLTGPGLVADHGLEFGSLPDGFDYALDLSDPTSPAVASVSTMLVPNKALTSIWLENEPLVANSRAAGSRGLLELSLTVAFPRAPGWSMITSPFCKLNSPWKELARLRARRPFAGLLRVPAPLRTLLTVSVAAGATSRVPPAKSTETGRLRVKRLVVCKVPPR